MMIKTEAVYYRMEQLGLTLKDVASCMGCSEEKALRTIENKREANIEEIERLEKILQFFGEESVYFLMHQGNYVRTRALTLLLGVNCKTENDVASVLNLSVPEIFWKMNNFKPFSRQEVETLAEWLGLSAQDFQFVFPYYGRSLKMKCPVCKIEMRRESADKWVCRNPQCSSHQKKPTNESGKPAN